MFQHNDLHRYTDPDRHHFDETQIQGMVYEADLHLAQRGYVGIGLIPLLLFVAAYTTDLTTDYPKHFFCLGFVMFLFCCGRLHSVLKIKTLGIASRQFWQRYYFLTSLGTGLCWGFLGAFVLYCYGATWENVVVLYMIAGIGGGTIISYSNWLHLNMFYLIVLFGPIAVVAFFICESNVALVGWLSIFSFLYNFSQAKQWNSVYWNSLMNVFLLDSEVSAHKKAQKLLCEEISERRKAQQSLVFAKEEAEEANNAKSEFLANMSHEMRTPMHAMLGFAKMGCNRYQKVPRERLGEYFSLIHESGDRLLRLLSDLLDLSTLEVDKSGYEIQQYDLNLSVKVLIDEAQFSLKEKGIEVVFHADGPKLAYFDRQKIMQVLHNLLNNAVKYSPRESTIAIHIGEMTDENGGKFQKVTVKDQGVGLPEGEWETIFEKFRQSSRTKSGAGGTGLGLAICQGIVTAHNGKIWVVNNPEGGASFSFTLPMG